MSIREFINKRPAALMSVFAIAAVVVALGIAQMKRSDQAMQGESASTYYTVDDGASWFADSTDHLAPFDHSGKIAVKVVLFTIDGGKTRFAGYLERYSDSARKTLLQSREGKMIPLSELTAAASDVEVKTPGAGTWVKRSDPTAKKILSVTVPPGQSGTPVLAQ